LASINFDVTKTNLVNGSHPSLNERKILACSNAYLLTTLVSWTLPCYLFFIDIWCDSTWLWKKV